ncbi:sensor histidine kinase [Dactylosporangium sp. NPDC005572]|uniref:sensor histidine kinase n=1 Tax=Dactylosporangium sp. NPDC005572 TaxID=3156889 RepID=UPI0033A668CE
MSQRRWCPSIAGMIWVAVWTFPLLDTLSTVREPVSGTALALFWALYVYTTALGFEGEEVTRTKRTLHAIVAALGLTIAAVHGSHWLVVLLFVSVCGIAVYGGTAKPVAALGLFLAALAATAVIGLAHGVPVAELASTLVATVLSSALVAVVRQLNRTVGELRRTREALAVAAVAEERLRFSRDLHDLLGHTLSVIVVKAEVVRRLAERDPAAAAAQAADIEDVGRRALVEIREAVTGYRESGLTAELTRARGALSSAGITAEVQRAAAPLPDPADHLLAWVLREAVTNVVRHSEARTCTITLTTDNAAATLSVADDGRFTATTQTLPGNGLRGLTERLRAVGGTLETGPRPGGGFTLQAHVPLPAPA